MASSEALEYLRKTRDLEGASEYSGGEKEYLINQLGISRRSAQRALGLMPLYRGDVEVRQEVRRLDEIVRALVGEVRE